MADWIDRVGASSDALPAAGQMGPLALPVHCIASALHRQQIACPAMRRPAALLPRPPPNLQPSFP